MALSTETRELTMEEKLQEFLQYFSRLLFSRGLYFEWFIFNKMPVYLVEQSKSIAWVDGFGIYFGEDGIKRFGYEDFRRVAFLLRHEILHLALRHVETAKKYLAKAKTILEMNTVYLIDNVITDSIVNALIVESSKQLSMNIGVRDDEMVTISDIEKVLEADPVKLGLVESIDRMLYLVKTGVVEIRARKIEGPEIDLSKQPIWEEVGDKGVKVHIRNKRTGAEVFLQIIPDILPCTCGRRDVVPEATGGTSQGTQGREQEERHGSCGAGREPRRDAHGQEQREAKEGGTCQGRGSGAGRGMRLRDKGTGSGGGERGEKEGSETCPIHGSRGHRGRVKELKKGDFKGRTMDDLRNLIYEARDFALSMNEHKGASPTGYYEAIFELAEVKAKKPEWLAALDREISTFLSSKAVVSWKWYHKKSHGAKPGIRYLHTPSMYILLDVSGSMLGKDLAEALERIVYIAEKESPETRITLYTWSTDVSLPRRVDRKFASDLKKYKRIPINTGGTAIAPALESVLPRIRKDDVVVILTDGYITDIENPEVVEMMHRLARRAGLTIFASTGAIPLTLPKRMKKIKITS